MGRRPKFRREQLEFLRDLLLPRCCHVTGMHDPGHFEEKKYVCELQKRDAFDRARMLLGFKKISPSDPVSKEKCYWCAYRKEHPKP